MRQGLSDGIMQGMKDIVRRHMNGQHYRFFLFGSRATGEAQERSDIDLGIEAGQPLTGAILSDIREEMDQLPTLLKIDFIDFSQVDSTFKEIALKGCEVLDER